MLILASLPLNFSDSRKKGYAQYSVIVKVSGKRIRKIPNMVWRYFAERLDIERFIWAEGDVSFLEVKNLPISMEDKILAYYQHMPTKIQLTHQCADKGKQYDLELLPYSKEIKLGPPPFLKIQTIEDLCM